MSGTFRPLPEHGRERPLRERPVDVWALKTELEKDLARRFGKEVHLAVQVFDDRERQMDQHRRQMQSESAALAQRLLECAHALMNLSGRASWDSLSGVASTAVQRLSDVHDTLGTVAAYELPRLKREAEDFERHLEQSHAEAKAKRESEAQGAEQ